MREVARPHVRSPHPWRSPRGARRSRSRSVLSYAPPERRALAQLGHAVIGLFVLDEAVLDELQVLVPDESNPRSVVLVLLGKELDGRGLLDLHASGEGARRGLARLLET